MPGSTSPGGALWPLGVPPRLGMPFPERMLALAILRDRYGPPSESLREEAIPAPRLRPSDANRVLVAILATGPNFNTNFAALGLPVPVFGRGDAAAVHIPGSDALGIVVDAGPAVTRIKVGQAVILDSWTGRNIRGYETHDGFNAQFVLADEERVGLESTYVAVARVPRLDADFDPDSSFYAYLPPWSMREFGFGTVLNLAPGIALAALGVALWWRPGPTRKGMAAVQGNE